MRLNLTHLDKFTHDRIILKFWSMRNRVYYNPSPREEYIREARAALIAIEAARLPDGTMNVSESGRDCDGVQYTGYVHRNIPATLTGLNALYERVAEGADGPFCLYPINRNSDLPSYSSRDLTLEAFEDGHAHVLHA
jgi:hypothetical protein